MKEQPLNYHSLEALLEAIRSVSIAVLGDFCLDAYWFLDESASETSLETGLATRPVARQRLALGGAGNVAANLAALGCRRVDAYGAVGDDPWGREMLRLLNGLGIGHENMLVETEGWDTLVFVKPHAGGRELSRFDFGNFNNLADRAADELLRRLEERLADYGAVVVNQQALRGLHTPRLREGLAGLIGKAPKKYFVVDSRQYSDEYPGAYLKVNEREAARLTGAGGDDSLADGPISKSEVLKSAEALYKMAGRAVFLTRGERGCVVRDERGLHEIPAVRIAGPIDPVGAGDTMLAGIAAALAAGCEPACAAALGNLAAAVTVRKIFQTGSATAQEILALAANPDMI